MLKITKTQIVIMLIIIVIIAIIYYYDNSDNDDLSLHGLSIKSYTRSEFRASAVHRRRFILYNEPERFYIYFH